MKTGTSFSIMAIASFIITLLWYIIDADPLYDDFTMVILEFGIITALFFTAFATTYFIARLVIRIVTKA